MRFFQSEANAVDEEEENDAEITFNLGRILNPAELHSKTAKKIKKNDRRISYFDDEKALASVCLALPVDKIEFSRVCFPASAS